MSRCPSTAPPKLTAFEISGFVYLTDEVPTLSIRILADDDQSDAGLGSVGFVTPFYKSVSMDGEYYYKEYHIKFNSIEWGSQGAFDSFKLDPEQNAATVQINILRIRDGFGNYSYYGAQDLRDLGFATSFEIMDGLHRVGSLADETPRAAPSATIRGPRG